MDHNVRVNVVGGAVVLALGVAVSAITSTVVVARTLDRRTQTQARGRQDIIVKGSARTRVRSDTAVWDITIDQEDDKLPKAYAGIEAGVERVRTFLTSAGFKPDELALSAIATTTHYARDAQGNATRQITGYTLQRSFTVTSADVARVDKTAAEVTSLIKDGVRVVSAPPCFYVSKLPELRVQILGDAAKDARGRAEEIVKNTGGKVGMVRDVQAGILQLTRPNSTDVSSYGVYDTSTIEKDVAVVVTATFAIDN